MCSLCTLAQESAQSASLHGVISDPEGEPIAQAVVRLQRNDSENFQTQTDAQGTYTFTKVPSGMYHLSATKDGYSQACIDTLVLGPREAEAVDLTISIVQKKRDSPAAAPQFSDEPQFTVAGVTDASNLGGHGPDTVVRTRDSLAKETVSLGAKTTNNPVDEALLRKLDEHPSDDSSANHHLGHVLIAMGMPKRAIPYLERAAAKDPSNYENAYDLTLANFQAGNFTIARDSATKLLVTHDQAEVHHLLGDINEKLGNSLEAVRHYQRAAELDPTEPYLFDWGAELLLHHAPEPAIEVFAKGNRLFPSSRRILLGLGSAYFAHGDDDHAILRISQASDLSPSDPVPYQFLGKIEQSQKIPSTEVVEKLHRFVTLQPQNAEANYYYALGLWKRRQAATEKSSVAQIESLLKAALQIDPKCAPAELQLGLVHSDLGSNSEAIAHFRKALELDPQLEEAHYRLAQVYRQSGNSDQAKEELRLYSALQKQSDEKQDRERHEIKQFVYTLRDQSTPQVH